MDKSPVKKKKWFTVEEKSLLRQLVQLNSSVLNTGHRKGVSVQAKKRAWQSITDVYNDHPNTLTPRTVIELRRCWDCMKFYAKKRSGNLSELAEGDTSSSSISLAKSKEAAILPPIAASETAPALQHLPLPPHLLSSMLAKEHDVTVAHGDDEQAAVNTNSSKQGLLPQAAANSSKAVSSALRWLRRENTSLKRRVLSQEVALLQQSARCRHQEHLHRLRRDTEEHQARIAALRQDFALKNIMFRVQACQLQPDADSG